VKTTDARLMEVFAERVVLTPKQTQLLCRNASREIGSLRSKINTIRESAERTANRGTDAECRVVLKNLIKLAKAP
jgi:hypothetical protein